MTNEYDDRVVENLIVRDDAEYSVKILVYNGIQAFIWDDGHSYKVVVEDVDDLERAKLLV